MNMKKILMTVGGIIVIGLALTFVFMMGKSAFFGKNGTANTTSTMADPFLGMVIPPEYASDPATKAVIERKIELVKKAYSEKPGTWETWIAVGDIKSLLKDYNGAIAAYRNSLALNSHNIVGYRNLAVVYENNLNDFQKAAENYKLAIDNNPGDIENYIELARVQSKRLNHPLDAEKTLKDGLKVTNYNPDLWLTLVRHYQSVGDTKNYTEQAKALMEAYPANTQYKELFKDIVK
jgi:tetratricopeptide (TPR) repeat protein